MRARAALGLLGLLAGLAAGAAPAGATVGFGAAVFNPAAAAPFAVAGLRGLAPVTGAWAIRLTRSVDAASPGLARAHAHGVHYRTVRLAWSVAGGAASLCLDDVAVTGYTRRPPPGAPGAPGVGAGGGAVEELTLSYAAATRALGLGACRRRPVPPPVVVRLYAEGRAAVRARVDCLAARCSGSLRLRCLFAGCPATGLPLGAFALGAGRGATVRARLPRPLGPDHPGALTVAVALAGRAAPLVLRVVLDAPPAVVVPTLTSTVPSSSTAPTPPGLLPAGGGPGGGASARAPGGGGSGAGGSGGGAAGGAGPGAAGPGAAGPGAAEPGREPGAGSSTRRSRSGATGWPTRSPPCTGSSGRRSSGRRSRSTTSRSTRRRRR